MLRARIPKGALILLPVPLKEARQDEIAVSSSHEGCRDGVSLGGRTGRVACKQRGCVCRGLIDDPEVGWFNHLHIGDGVDETPSVSLVNDLIADDKFIDPQEHLVFAHPMTGDNDITLSSRHRSSGPVARAQVKGGESNSLVQPHFDVDSGNRNGSELDHGLCCPVV